MGSNDRGRMNQASRTFEKELATVGEALVRFDQSLDSKADQDIILTGLTLRSPLQDERGEWLCIIRVVIAGKRYVGFSGGESLMTVLRHTANRWMNGDIKWKEDEYAR